ncbi:MAG: hypothetical protein M1833_004888 [Piccolia ochrophora]|nr:MAG: hypothetical protein M1833_004888 [Piccolia ochrophora]
MPPSHPRFPIPLTPLRLHLRRRPTLRSSTLSLSLPTPLSRTHFTTPGQPPHQRLKHEYLVLAPDLRGPTTLAARVAARPTHIAALPPLLASGFYKMGGATLSAEYHPAEPSDGAGGGEIPRVDPGEARPVLGPQMNGSALVVEAESSEEVEAVLRRDVYGRGEVWDWERVVIMPVSLGGSVGDLVVGRLAGG